MMRRALPALIALAACTPPDAPAHLGAYPFDSDGNDSGYVFHWPGDRLPVRIWVEARGNLPALVQRGIDIWQDQFLYGEFTGTLVSDSTHADVIVTWSDSVPPTVPPDSGPPVKACGGLTQIDSLAGNQIVGAFHSSIDILRIGATAGQVEACVQRTVIHELGHDLGVLNDDAPDSTDIMYFTPYVSLPSAADRATVQLLYHTTPNLLPPPR